MDERDYITTNEAAVKLGLSRNRILDLIRFGRLPATKVGGVWLIKVSDLQLVENRKPGRPRKAKQVNSDKKGTVGEVE
jgi:excisionase family DNA binding protein